jgi:hypothetical protein
MVAVRMPSFDDNCRPILETRVNKKSDNYLKTDAKIFPETVHIDYASDYGQCPS